jgi:Secretion system C-terminal sorting domain
MKKLVLFVVVLSTFGFIQGQNLQVFYGEEDITNDTVKIEVDADTDPSALHVEVKNVSENAIDVKVRKIEETIVEGTSISLCWGVNCYSPTQFETPTAATIDAGATDDSFHGDYFHFGNPGTSIVTYVFFDDANPTDSSYIVVEYKLASVGIDMFELSNFSNPFPNPATEFVNFFCSVNSETTLNIYDAVGKLVDQKILTEVSNEIEISTSNLSSGTYFYEFRKENVVLENGKIVISK